MYELTERAPLYVSLIAPSSCLLRRYRHLGKKVTSSGNATILNAHWFDDEKYRTLFEEFIYKTVQYKHSNMSHCSNTDTGCVIFYFVRLQRLRKSAISLAWFGSINTLLIRLVTGCGRIITKDRHILPLILGLSDTFYSLYSKVSPWNLNAKVSAWMIWTPDRVQEHLPAIKASEWRCYQSTDIHMMQQKVSTALFGVLYHFKKTH